MKPMIEEDIHFIEKELLPEMLYNRCFCESNSREFVELESIKIEPCKTYSHHLNFSFYRAEIVIQFSGEPRTFYILVKLLPENSLLTKDASISLAYNGFLNEEIMWNKGSLQYGRDFFPKFYVANMGKYNKPVIVVEDLEKNGFVRILDRELNQEEASLVMKTIGSFHGKGIILKEINFSIFRELYTKFEEIIFSKLFDMETEKNFLRFINRLKSASFDDNSFKEFENIFGNNSYRTCRDNLLQNVCKKTSTICQGLLIQENLWFRKRNDENMELKILDWTNVRYGSNSIDLATVLAQCKTDLWNDLIEIYIKAVQQEQPSISNEDLRAEFSNPGFIYAFIILSFENNRLLQFSNILSYLAS